MKKSDHFILGILIAVFGVALGGYFTNSVLAGVALATALCALYVSCYLFLRKKTNMQSKESFYKEVLLRGKEESNRLLSLLYPEYKGEDALTNGMLLLNRIRYGALGEEDVAAAYRLARTLRCEHVRVYVRKTDKNAAALALSLPLRFEFLDLKNLFYELKKQNVLPTYPAKGKRKNLRTILLGVKNVPVKYFFFCAISLAALSLIVPLKVYYLSLAALNAAIGLTLAFLKRNSPASE